MDKAIYIAMAAGKNIMQAQAIHANNLANVNTSGFQTDFVQARSFSSQPSGSHDTRAYSLAESTGTNFSRGPIIETGGELDMAIDGDGWIAVQAPDGTEAFTRYGAMKINAVGQLVTGNNLPVLGNGGPIALPPFDNITLGSDGTITIQPEGQQANVLSVVDRVKLVNPNYEDLAKGLDGLVRRVDGQGEEPDASIRLQAGFIESSNVDAISEMTNIMALARDFEVSVKMMRTVEENSSALAQVLRSQ